MSFWGIANIIVWILCGVFALLIAVDFIRTERSQQEHAETLDENGGPTV